MKESSSKRYLFDRSHGSRSNRRVERRCHDRVSHGVATTRPYSNGIRE
jgi:hypothetical protein